MDTKLIVVNLVSRITVDDRIRRLQFPVWLYPMLSRTIFKHDMNKEEIEYGYNKELSLQAYNNKNIRRRAQSIQLMHQ